MEDEIKGDERKAKKPFQVILQQKIDSRLMAHMNPSQLRSFYTRKIAQKLRHVWYQQKAHIFSRAKKHAIWPPGYPSMQEKSFKRKKTRYQSSGNFGFGRPLTQCVKRHLKKTDIPHDTWEEAVQRVNGEDW